MKSCCFKSEIKLCSVAGKQQHDKNNNFLGNANWESDSEHNNDNGGHMLRLPTQQNSSLSTYCYYHQHQAISESIQFHFKMMFLLLLFFSVVFAFHSVPRCCLFLSVGHNFNALLLFRLILPVSVYLSHSVEWQTSSKECNRIIWLVKMNVSISMLFFQHFQ